MTGHSSCVCVCVWCVACLLTLFGHLTLAAVSLSKHSNECICSHQQSFPLHTHKQAQPQLDSHLEDTSWFTANAKHFHKIDNEHCFWWMQREMDERKGRGKHKSRWRERKSDGNEWGLVSQMRGNSASYWWRSATAAHQRKHEGNTNMRTQECFMT